MLKSVLYVLAIVSATALVLYPVISRLLDLFEGIARDLYDRFGGKDGNEAREELRRITDRYFRAAIAALI